RKVFENRGATTTTTTSTTTLREVPRNASVFRNQMLVRLFKFAVLLKFKPPMNKCNIFILQVFLVFLFFLNIHGLVRFSPTPSTPPKSQAIAKQFGNSTNPNYVVLIGTITQHRNQLSRENYISSVLEYLTN